MRNSRPTENMFQEYKAKCPSYFKEDEEKEKEKEEEKDSEKEKEEEDKEERKVCKSWDFKEQLVFQRFDSFVERLKTIQDFCNTANQFLKLEKVCEDKHSNREFLFDSRWKLVESGVRCSLRQFRKSMRLSERSMQFLETGGNPSLILTQFPKISFRQYDSLDPKDKSFLKDYRKFNSKVWMLDRKLSAILTRLAFLILFPFSPQFPELLTTVLSPSRSSSCCTSLATWCRGTSSPSSSPTRCRS